MHAYYTLLKTDAINKIYEIYKQMQTYTHNKKLNLS